MSGPAVRSVALAVLLVLATVPGGALATSSGPSTGAAGADGDAAADRGTAMIAGDSLASTVRSPVASEQPASGVVRHELTRAGPGAVRVDLSVGLTDQTTEFRVTLPAEVSVTATDGFEQTGDDRTYAWDGRTEMPSLRYRAGVNRTVGGSQRFAATESWALLDVTDLDAAYRWRSFGDTEYRRQFHAPEGYVGSAMAFLGSYEAAATTANGERFVVVVPDAATANASADAFATTLCELSGSLRVGGRSGEVTAFVAPAPVGADGGGEGGLGGLATRSDLWVAAATATEPGPDGDPRVRRSIWAHEYLHTRQNYTLGGNLTWFTEASAYHYMTVVPRQRGELDAAAFSRRYRVPDRRADAVLRGSRRYGVWSSKGARVLAALDRRLREATNGSRTLQDLIVRMNAHEGEVTSAEFREMAAATAGASQDDWFDAHVAGAALPPPPDPDAYPARNVSLSPRAVEYERDGTWTVVGDGPLPAGVPLRVRHPTAGVVVRPGGDAAALNVSGGDPATVRLPAGEARLVVQPFYGDRSRTVSVTTSADVDGDGVTNAAEREQGSDPFDAESTPGSGSEGDGTSADEGGLADGDGGPLGTATGTGPGLGGGIAAVAVLLFAGWVRRRGS